MHEYDGPAEPAGLAMNDEQIITPASIRDDWPRLLIDPSITVAEICAAMDMIRCDVIYGDEGLRVERRPKSPRRRKDKDPKP